MSGTHSIELLTAVREFLRSEVLPELKGFTAYSTRVAANMVGIVAREIEMGAGLSTLDQDIANVLELNQASGEITQQIACGLRDRTLQVDATLLSYLKKRTMLSLAIDNPKYSGLQQARSLWVEDQPMPEDDPG